MDFKEWLDSIGRDSLKSWRNRLAGGVHTRKKSASPALKKKRRKMAEASRKTNRQRGQKKK